MCLFRKRLLAVWRDAHSIDITSIFDITKIQIRIVIVLKIPTRAKSKYSGIFAVLTAKENPTKRIE